MNSREKILNRLRAVPKPFTHVPEIAQNAYLPMVPMGDKSPATLQARFMEEAQKISSKVYPVPDSESAIQQILTLIGDSKQVLSWDMDQIPVRGLAEALKNEGITFAAPGDPSVRIGLTGASVGLAATGSLVFVSGAGKPRLAGLIPPVHVAVLTTDQLVPDLESWAAMQRQTHLEAFKHANISVISGPSRTGDIEMEIVMGVHGPGEVHIILIGT
jgi:L-lactate dehydrogenase complex protein LldG